MLLYHLLLSVFMPSQVFWVTDVVTQTRCVVGHCWTVTMRVRSWCEMFCCRCGTLVQYTVHNYASHSYHIIYLECMWFAAWAWGHAWVVSRVKLLLYISILCDITHQGFKTFLPMPMMTWIKKTRRGNSLAMQDWHATWVYKESSSLL